MATGRVPTTANSPLTTKGDLFTYDTSQARLAVGNSGETLVADSSTSTGLRWQGDYAAGKNKIINGDFNINQRGFTSTTTSNTYGFDRWTTAFQGDGTATYSAQTFTPGSAPVAGYESTNFARLVTASQTTSNIITRWEQRLENVRTFAGQTMTLSFWAKAASGTPKITYEYSRTYGAGGSASDNLYGGQVTISTSWARYSITVNIDSVSGKTIVGDGSFIVRLWVSAGSDFAARTNSMGIQNNTFDIWGVQAENGSVATAFQTATGTLQGELAACQRYFQLLRAAQAWGTWYSTTDAALMAGLPVAMRVTPTATFSTNYTNAIVEVGVTDRTPTSYAAYKTSNQAFSFLANGMTTSATIRQGAVYIGPDHQLSAEL